MANAERVDPYRNFNFIVEIDAIENAVFAECTGLGSQNDPIEYREGTDLPTVRKLPGLTKFNNIVLKWGITDNSALYDWYEEVTKGVVKRKNGSIVVIGLAGERGLRWNFFRAWPTKWDAADFVAKGTDVAIETLELAVEGVERAKR